MKSWTIKQICLCVWLILIGGVLWYLIANHQFHKKAPEERFNERPFMNPWFSDDIPEFNHKKRHMQNIFDNLEREFFDDNKHINEDIRNEQFDYDQLKDLSGNYKSNWMFHYYEEKKENWNNTSYNLDGKRNEWKTGWNIIMSGTNEKWKKFSYSWTIQNWETKWILTDEDWNNKNLDLNNLNIKKIYNNSNKASK